MPKPKLKPVLEALGVASMTAELSEDARQLLAEHLCRDESSVQGKPLLAIAPAYLVVKHREDGEHRTEFTVSTLWGQHELAMTTAINDAEYANPNIEQFYEQRMVGQINHDIDAIGGPALTERVAD